jgi:hypothetical protein
VRRQVRRANRAVFERSATHIDELFSGPRQVLSGGVVVGGLLTIELNLLFDHVRLMLDRHADDLRDLATTCRDRAEACAEYEVQVRAFHDATDAYQSELRRWTSMSELHDQAPTLAPSPGPPPLPPLAPVAPPTWMSSGSAR